MDNEGSLLVSDSGHETLFSVSGDFRSALESFEVLPDADGDVTGAYGSRVLGDPDANGLVTTASTATEPPIFSVSYLEFSLADFGDTPHSEIIFSIESTAVGAPGTIVLYGYSETADGVIDLADDGLVLAGGTPVVELAGSHTVIEGWNHFDVTWYANVYVEGGADFIGFAIVTPSTDSGIYWHSFEDETDWTMPTSPRLTAINPMCDLVTPQ